MRWMVNLLLVSLSSGLAWSVSNATTFERAPTLEEITEDTSLSFRGRVVAISYGQARLHGGRKLPFTRIELDVEHGYAGTRAGERITLRQPGGPIDGDFSRFVIVPGLARFRPDERVVVFADHARHPGIASVYGDRGVLRIRDSGAGPPMVVDSAGRPLTVIGDSLRAARDARCRPVRNTASSCSLEVGGNAADAFATVDDLDAHMGRVMTRRRANGEVIANTFASRSDHDYAALAGGEVR